MRARTTGRPAVRARVARLAALALAVVLSGACASTGSSDDPEPTEVRPLEILARATLEPVGEGLSTHARLVLSLAPKEPVPIDVIAEGDGQVSDAFVEVRLQWKDFFGLEPTSLGRGRTLHLPFGPDGSGSRTAPLVRTLDLELEDPDPRVLARRITVDAVLRPIDIEQGEARSGGAALPFPRQTASVFLHPVDESLEALLAADPPRDPVAIFTAGAREGLDRPLPTLTALVDALPVLEGAEREALFGALLFLTGETNFRSIPQWKSWLAAHAAAEEHP
ncbi:MAG: hypothetical protein H6825_14340 [Planctomycetes bacterium]|nr:hypothetical protein [Planctomycetota bacterium]